VKLGVGGRLGPYVMLEILATRGAPCWTLLLPVPTRQSDARPGARATRSPNLGSGALTGTSGLDIAC